MARTVLRSRSGDIVTAVRLADRTGIVAASAPPAVPAWSEPADSAGTAPAGPGSPSKALRRVRQNILLTCAAAMFVGLGWIGGGVFAHRDAEQGPAVAAGVVVDQDGRNAQEQPQAPASTGAVPKPAAQPAGSANRQKQITDGTKRAVKARDTTTTTTTTSTTPTTPTPRGDLLDTTTSTVHDSGDAAKQLQQLVGSWSWTPTKRYHLYYGRYPTYPGSYGR